MDDRKPFIDPFIWIILILIVSGWIFLILDWISTWIP